MAAVAKSVVEARFSGTAKRPAAKTVKSVGLGEARPAGVAKYRAERKSKLAESSLFGVAKCRAAKVATADDPTVVASVGVGEARPRGFAKYSATSQQESELVGLIGSAVVKSVGGARPGTSPGVGPVQGKVPESVQGGR